MKIPILSGLDELADDYDLFIFDLWGVVHNGKAAYPGALDCLRRLRQRGAKVVLLSNAARLSDVVAQQLAGLGVTADLYDRVLTSGDATAYSLKNDAQHQKPPACFYLGPQHSRSTFAACGGREVPIEDAALIICTGFLDGRPREVEDYRALLTKGVAHGLTLVCVNPDVVAIHDGRAVPCAGALAALYEDLGGHVQRFGKPFSAIYDRLFAEFPETPRARAVMIGDSLVTDIRGARTAAIDAIWIGDGVHATALVLGADGQLQPDRVQAVAAKAGECPRAIMFRLSW